MDNNILLTLSRIFKQGYTIQVNNDNIKQYSNSNKSYIVSYKTLITIKNDIPIFNKHCKIPKKCIMGYWYSKKTNIGYIELNKAFNYICDAIKYAKKHKQLYIYNVRNGSYYPAFKKGVKP